MIRALDGLSPSKCLPQRDSFQKLVGTSECPRALAKPMSPREPICHLPILC